MKINQNGFSVVEIIMAIVIVGLVGAVGWLFWNQATGKTASSASTSSVADKKSPQVSPESTSGIKTYQNKALGIAFNYPSTWTLSDSTSSRYKSIDSDDIKKVQSPDGFILVFSTLSLSGYGGAGPCPAVSGFKNFGASKISNVYTIIQDDSSVKNGIILQLSNTQTEKDANTNCMYQDMIQLREPSEDMQPYGFTFGTMGAISRPSDKDLNDAAAILMSTHRY